MRGLLAVLAMCVAFLGAPATAHAQAGVSLSGDWRGAFTYAAGAGQAAEFALHLQESGGRLTGTTTELNTFGAADAIFLLASVTGDRAGDSVHFVKTYDGTGGQTHSIVYSGRILPGGRRIVGTWSGVGSLNTASGQFEMVR